jgi:hypothetical protein
MLCEVIWKGFLFLSDTVEFLYEWFNDCAGYPSFKGQVLNGQQLWDLIEGLEANDLLYYTHLLTGTIVYDVKDFLICIILLCSVSHSCAKWAVNCARLTILK